MAVIAGCAMAKAGPARQHRLITVRRMTGNPMRDRKCVQPTRRRNISGTKTCAYAVPVSHFIRNSENGKRLAILDGLLVEQTPVQAASTRRVWTRILAIIAFFAAFEGILFHTPFYSS